MNWATAVSHRLRAGGLANPISSVGCDLGAESLMHCGQRWDARRALCANKDKSRSEESNLCKQRENLHMLTLKRPHPEHPPNTFWISAFAN